MIQNSDVQIDVTGMCCPVPLIELAKAVQSMSGGELLTVKGNDPIFEQSVIDFCTVNGHTVLDVAKNQQQEVTVRIRIGGQSD